jgi:ABC-type amino acid transport substrate-binding protein
MLRLLIILLCLTLYRPISLAQTGGQRTYSDEHPLVFEHSYNLFPYSYRNEHGEPAGYFIDLIDLLMNELGIPYVVELKPQKEALKDLKEGKADLSIGLGSIYDKQFGNYGRITLTLLTQSLVTPQRAAVKVKSLSDFEKEQVMVQDSSICHHLMVDYGWGENAIVSKDLSEDIREMNKTLEGQAVWNTPALKWVVKNYNLRNLKITPVDMPHGECRFIAGDPYLLEMVERFYEYMYSNGKIAALEEKWFEEQPAPEPEPKWHWYLAVFGMVLLVSAIIYMLIELRYNRKATKKYHELTQNLTKVAQNNKYRFWTYYVGEFKFTWHDEHGTEISTQTAEEFAKRYEKADFEKLKEALERLINMEKDNHGHYKQQEELEIRARDTEFGDNELHGFVVHLSVLSRNHHGKPTVIVCTKKDVTREMELKLQNQELSLRYLSTFYNNESGIMIFDHDGYLQNANQKASELMGWDIDEMVKKRMHIKTILGYDNDIKLLSETDGLKGTIANGGMTADYQVKTITDENNELIGLYVFCI